MAKPSKKALGKRKAPPSQNAASKKPKQELGPTGKPKRKPDQPKKVKLRDQKIIPIPRTQFDTREDEDEEEGIMDMELDAEEGLQVGGGAARFLTGLDRNALSRSTRETKRLHALSKTNEPLPKARRNKLKIPFPESANMSADDFDSDDEFPEDLASDVDGSLGEPSGSGSGSGSDEGEELENLGSSGDDEDEDDNDDNDQSDMNSAFDEAEDDESDEEEEFLKRRKGKKDEEAEYETSGRSRWAAKAAKVGTDDEHVEVGRLPIKLPTGEVQMVEGSTRLALPPSKKPKRPEPESDTEEEEEDEEDEGSDDGAQAERMANQKGRFGRMNVAEIVGTSGWKNAQRLEAAKEQIANIGAEILAGGELVDIAPTLTRLSTFALPTVPAPEDHQLLPVPTSIRGLAFLSQLAVYKDLIPGYRIRQLTELEESEKVREEVRRLREGEKMLVRSYKGYLKMLEGEIKRKTPLASLCLKCMCELLSSVTHFNFSENIMGVLVGRLGRRSWDDDADLILQTFISVFRADLTAVHSQTLVRLIARMIKERKYQVHPNVLSCLLHLRLRTELDKMKDGKHSQKGKGKRDVTGQPAIFKSDVRRKWQTKNQKKREKEAKEQRKELAEAEAEVNREERAQTQTETLKNLFVLYFSIIKHPQRSPLLAAALEGISTFAHFINVDFFRDLLAVLRRIVQEELYDDAAPDDPESAAAHDGPVGSGERMRIRLLAIATAFDLLSGQGEALNIDLGDFINALFALLRPLSLDTGIEDPPYNPSSLPATTKPIRPLQAGRPPPKAPVQVLSTSTLLFRCLHAVFFSRHTTASTATAPPWRAAAFAKRLTEVALLLPPQTARQAVDFVRALMARDNKLEGMLDSEERMFDGVYKAELDDPQLVNASATSLYELDILARRYWDKGVREVAAKLRDGKVV